MSTANLFYNFINHALNVSSRDWKDEFYSVLASENNGIPTDDIYELFLQFTEEAYTLCSEYFVEFGINEHFDDFYTIWEEILFN